MKSILRNTAMLSGSSIASILMGLASAKVLATLLGPAGFGLVGLLHSLLTLASLIVGLGIGTALVRSGAHAVSNEQHEQMANLRTGAWLVTACSGGCALLIFVLFRTSISRFMLGGPEHADSMPLIGLALLFTLAATLQTSTLNAYRRLKALAIIGVLNALLNAVGTITLIWIWGDRGIVPAVITGAGISWMVSLYFLRRQVGTAHAGRKQEVFRASWSLFRFGAPFALSTLVGIGVQLALPILVLHTLGMESVGFYRAAAAVAVNYLGFLLTAMCQDYYPRVSAAADRADQLVRLVNEQHRLTMSLSGPVILGTLAMVPYLIPLLYTSKFEPAVQLLQWQLVGDVLKFSSWTLGFVVLARRGGLIYFFTELSAGVTTLVAAWLGIRWFGLPGLGFSFLATYVVYYLVVWTIVRRDIQLVWSSENKRLLLTSVFAALAVQLLSFSPWTGFTTLAALALATMMGVRTLFVFRRELSANIPVPSRELA